ncbi:hypothetical protein HK098_002978 [Nowakowskiella sp. JEL0407]|nr:hypothetical protein HK098_002978 [Nowakowskiella sp. JEL0407]
MGNLILVIPATIIASFAASWAYNWLSIPKHSNYTQKTKKTFNYHEIPGPIGVPIFGSYLSLLTYVARKRSDLFFDDITQSYGSIARFTMLGRKFIVTSDAKISKVVLNNTNDLMRDNTLEYASEGVNEYALFTLQSGDIWKKHRKALQPAFGPHHIRKSSKICLQYVDELIGLWMKEVKDGVVTRDINRDFLVMSGDIISTFALGAELGALKKLAKNEELETLQLIKRLGEVFAKRLRLVPLRPIWSLFGISTRDTKSDADRLVKILYPFIERKRDALNDVSKTNSKDDSEYDLLDRLVLPVTRNSISFSDKEILGELLSFYASGQETSAHEINWIIYEFCLNSDVQERLLKEINEVLGDKAPDLEILPKLPYLDAVLKESMRHHCILTQLSRKTLTDMQFTSEDGEVYNVPKDCKIFVNIEGIHRSKRYWGEDADVFNPSRWFNSDGSEFIPIPGSYLPFGDGPFNCIGQKLAIVESKITIIRLLQNFSVKISAKQGKVTPVHTITLGIKNSFVVDLFPRN